MSTKLALTSGGSASFAPEEFYSSFVYSGDSTARSIVNGINLSFFGGLVMTKSRTTNAPVMLIDTVRGANTVISTTSGQTAGSTTQANTVTAFNTDGYSLGVDATGNHNATGTDYVSWSFRRARRFFDIVTYTGTGAALTVNHSLGATPGFIMVKRTDATGGSFFAYHISAGAGNVIGINSGTAATASATAWNNTAPTTQLFYVGANTDTNASGATYVAYLWAHDTASDGIIQCGSYTGTGVVGTGPTVTLNWEPSFLLIKPNGALASDYSATISDDLRGISYGDTRPAMLDEIVAEGNYSAQVGPLPTGFKLLAAANDYNAALTYYYVAIRRPTKRPISATQVFTPYTYTGTNAALNITAPGFQVDFMAIKSEDGNWAQVTNRIAGAAELQWHYNIAAATYTSTQNVTSLASMTGYSLGTNTGSSTHINILNKSYVGWAFKRATGFFDIVHFTGSGTNQNIQHQLGTTPELMFIKARSTATHYWLYHKDAGNTQYFNFSMQSSGLAATTSATAWNNTSPTSTQFTVGTDAAVNGSGVNCIAYLFASSPGVSKVGSYTGNGTSQTIDCGFSSGFRFVMAKRVTSATTAGHWFVVDTARGVAAGNDSVVSFNSNAGWSTIADFIDQHSSGFIVNQETTYNLNVNGEQYVYLAIA